MLSQVVSLQTDTIMLTVLQLPLVATLTSLKLLQILFPQAITHKAWVMPPISGKTFMLVMLQFTLTLFL